MNEETKSASAESEANKETKKEESNPHGRAEKKHKHWEDGHCCNNNEGGSVFGLMLIFAGLILILNFLNLASRDIWQIIFKAWPAILVIMGISLIFGRNIVGRIITSIAAFIIFSLISIYGLLKVDSPALKYIPQGVVNYVENITSGGDCVGNYCKTNNESKDEFLQN